MTLVCYMCSTGWPAAALERVDLSCCRRGGKEEIYVCDVGIVLAMPTHSMLFFQCMHLLCAIFDRGKVKGSSVEILKL